MQHYTILGLMSGSSCDGLDLAAMRFTVGHRKIRKWEFLDTRLVPLEEDDVLVLRTLHTRPVQEYLRTDARIGIWMGEQCKKFIEDTGLQPDFIASHGHTVLHHPDLGYTAQIGHPAHIAARSGCPVIADFRSADIAAGGQGAPLAPVAERYLFPGHTFYLNLGGIANLSMAGETGYQAWDICPANQLLNYLARRVGKSFDDKGEIARSGRIIPELMHALQSINTLPVHQARSMNNTFIEQHYFPLVDAHDAPVEDLLRSAVEYISVCIAKQIHAQTYGVPTSMMITGGGAHNAFLVSEIRDSLNAAGIDLVLPASTIIDFKEAALIALCGLLHVCKMPNSFASVTGAEVDTVNGAMYLPPRS